MADRAQSDREKALVAQGNNHALRSLQIQAVLLERERARAKLAEEERRKAEIDLEALKVKTELEKVRLQRMAQMESSRARRAAIQLRREENKTVTAQDKELRRAEEAQRRRHAEEDAEFDRRMRQEAVEDEQN